MSTLLLKHPIVEKNFAIGSTFFTNLMEISDKDFQGFSETFCFDLDK
jgi:hypothetical protein